MSHSSNHATSLKDTNPHTSHGEVKVDSNRTHHNSMTAVQDKDNTKANVEDNTNETSLVEVRKFKTPRALLPRQPTGEADNESPTTPPNSLKIHGATSSATAKAKITIVACQECQRKKCKVCGQQFLYHMQAAWDVAWKIHVPTMPSFSQTITATARSRAPLSCPQYCNIRPTNTL